MRTVVALLVALLVAGCGSTSSPAPDETASPSSPTATSASSTPEPVSSLTADEAALADGIRADAAIACIPIREDLPPGAIAGVGCRPGTDDVLTIGVYLFPDDRAATRAYLERLGEYGIQPRSGGCAAGSRGGDSAWTPGDDVGQITAADGLSLNGQIYVLSREGCFIDENGKANSRVTCGPRYIGVLGKTADLEAVHRWTKQYPEGAAMDTPTPPGICVPN